MSDEAACSQNMQWAWRTQAPSACSPEPAPRARPGTAPGRTAQRWWRGPATEQPARCQLRSPSGGLRRRGSAHVAPRGNPLCPVCSRAASAAGESGQAHASGRTCMLQAQKSGSNSYIYIRHGYALRCRPCPLRRMQRVPGHHRAHGRSGEPGHHDMAKSHVETGSKARAPAAAHTRSAEPRFASPATLLLTQRGTGPQVAPMFDAPDGLKGYVGEEDGFDPLRLSSAFDMVCRPPPCVRLSEM